MRDVRVGDLVSFITVDYGIDIEAPVGYAEPHDFSSIIKSAWIKSITKDTQIHPLKNEAGIIIESRDIQSQNSKTIQRWFKVLVREQHYWFHSSHLNALF